MQKKKRFISSCCLYIYLFIVLYYKESQAHRSREQIKIKFVESKLRFIYKGLREGLNFLIFFFVKAHEMWKIVIEFWKCLYFLRLFCCYYQLNITAPSIDTTMKMKMYDVFQLKFIWGCPCRISPNQIYTCIFTIHSPHLT